MRFKGLFNKDEGKLRLISLLGLLKIHFCKNIPQILHISIIR